MRKYRVIEISEKELEDLVRQAPELIEAGLKFVDHQAFTTRGPLDVLLVDSGRALIVAELKAVEDDTMLVQGIDYYDYVLRNLDGFARAPAAIFNGILLTEWCYNVPCPAGPQAAKFEG